MMYRYKNKQYKMIIANGNPILQPSSRQEAKMWNYAIKKINIYDSFQNIRQWPLLWQAAILSGHIQNEARYGLVNFFLGNGLEPMKILDFFQNYPGKVDMHLIQYLISRPYPYKYWDMHLGRYNNLPNNMRHNNIRNDDDDQNWYQEGLYQNRENN